MKDFDSERQARRPSEEQRTFRLGGETYVLRAGIRPEVLMEYDSLGENVAPVEALRVMDELMIRLIDPRDGAHARYTALRQREDDPIELPDLESLVTWVVETYTGRPTGQPSASGTGQNGTGTSSTADSPSPVTQMVPTA